jgi:hypothetical protein
MQEMKLVTKNGADREIAIMQVTKHGKTIVIPAADEDMKVYLDKFVEDKIGERIKDGCFVESNPITLQDTIYIVVRPSHIRGASSMLN